jgi:hypothetical protein
MGPSGVPNKQSTACAKQWHRLPPPPHIGSWANGTLTDRGAEPATFTSSGGSNSVAANDRYDYAYGNGCRSKSEAVSWRERCVLGRRAAGVALGDVQRPRYHPTEGCPLVNRATRLGDAAKLSQVGRAHARGWLRQCSPENFSADSSSGRPSAISIGDGTEPQRASERAAVGGTRGGATAESQKTVAAGQVPSPPAPLPSDGRGETQAAGGRGRGQGEGKPPPPVGG